MCKKQNPEKIPRLPRKPPKIPPKKLTLRILHTETDAI